MARSTTINTSSIPRPSTTTATGTLTLTETPESSSSAVSKPQALTLKLVRKKMKKKVTWKEGTVDNEFMNKKSSKKCCVFHKDKPFDEDDSDDDNDHDHRHRDCDRDHGCCSNSNCAH